MKINLACIAHAASLLLEASLLLLAVTAGPALGQACAEPQVLGTFGGTYSAAYDVSADGNVVVGAASNSLGQRRAFRWEQGVGMQDLGTLGGVAARAYAVTSDGSVVVGISRLPSAEFTVFRWTDAGGMQEVPGFIRTGADPVAVSDDGNTIVGDYVPVGTNRVRTFRWTSAGGIQTLGTLGGTFASPTDMSADGTVVVGYSDTGTQFNHTFRWTAAGGMQNLGALPGHTHSRAEAVSADGTVITGSSFAAGSNELSSYRWTASTGMVDIGNLGGSYSTPYLLSGDGNTIVGISTLPGPTFDGNLYRWTVGGGMQDLGELEVLDGQSVVPNGINVDGTVVVGRVFTTNHLFMSFRFQSSILGTTYCRPLVTNSTGCGGIVLAEGDPQLATGSLSLTAALLPLNSFGFFLTSKAQQFMPNPGGSQGNLCIGGSIGRLIGPGQVMNSGADGSFTLVVDLNALPQHSGFVAAQPGETWNFQAWHRDSNPTATSNFTDAVSITFE